MILPDMRSGVALAPRAVARAGRRPARWRLMFSQVREDPRVELAAARAAGGAGRVLTIASGGCTALSLLTLDEVSHVDAVDPNPLQIALCRFKQAALGAFPTELVRELLGDAPADPHWRRRMGRALGAGLDEQAVGEGLLQAGQFERLFASFRAYLHRFVCPPAELERLFDPEDPLDGPALLDRFDPAFWPVAFELFFGDRLLETVFGPAATQHAPAGTYPAYFRRAFERALRALPTTDNYFLSQILLGRSIGGRPPYLTQPIADRVDRLQLHPQDLARFLSRPRQPYDLINLSNVFDWMDAPAIERLCPLLLRASRPGTRILLRQINNQRPVPRALRDALEPLESESADWLARERSCRYRRLRIWRVR